MDIFTWGKIRLERSQSFVLLRIVVISWCSWFTWGGTPRSSNPFLHTTCFTYQMSMYLWPRSSVLTSQSSFSALCLICTVVEDLVERCWKHAEVGVRVLSCCMQIRFYFLCIVSNCHVTLPNFPLKGRGRFWSSQVQEILCEGLWKLNAYCAVVTVIKIAVKVCNAAL